MKLKAMFGLVLVMAAVGVSSVFAEEGVSAEGDQSNLPRVEERKAQRESRRTKRIDRREKHQDKRIDQGAQSGSLTQGEENALEKGQEHIKKLEDKALADGKIDPREAKRLKRAQNHQNRKIRRLKHNGRHQGKQDGKGPTAEQPSGDVQGGAHDSGDGGSASKEGQATDQPTPATTAPSGG